MFGFVGSDGLSGLFGVVGVDGLFGVSGFDGSDGVLGLFDVDGVSGLLGVVGVDGVSGFGVLGVFGFVGWFCPSITNCFSQVSLVTVFSESPIVTVINALAVYLPGLKPLKLPLSEL